MYGKYGRAEDTENIVRKNTEGQRTRKNTECAKYEIYEITKNDCWSMHLKEQKGFGLLDVMATMAIFSMTMIAIVAIFFATLKTKDVVFDQFNLQNDGRRAAQNFVGEIRGANYSSLGAYPLEEATNNEIIFYSNIDKDSYREKVRYFFAGGILKKGITKPSGSPLTYNPGTEVVSDALGNVQSGQFNYYDANYLATGNGSMSQPVTTSLVRMVGITIQMSMNSRTSPATFLIDEKATIRNLKDN